MQQNRNFILFETRNEFAEWLYKQKITRKINIIQNHHTWVPNYSNFNGRNHFERLEAMRNFHMKDRGFSEVAQNITTFPDGSVAISLGRDLNKTPAGITGKNTGAICIEHFGDFDIGKDKMKDEHRKTIIFVNAIFCKLFNLTPNTNNIVYHAWFASKTCPGTAFFGGNKRSDAENNFIPLIKEELGKLNNKGRCKVDELVKWQVDMGNKAVDELAKKGILANPEEWKNKLGEHVPNWLFFELANRILNNK